ncbi:MAG: M4 family metallopeptidase [Bacteroidia bacterium]
MKQLLHITCLIALTCGMALGQRTFEEKSARSTVPTKPGLPYMDIDGRTATSPSPSPYKGIAGAIKLKIAANKHPDVRVLARDEAGLPIFLETKPAASKNIPSDPGASAILFLQDIHDMIGIDDPEAEFQIRSVDEGTVRLSQQWNGVPVWGSDIAVNFTQNGQVIFSGRYKASNTMPPTQANVAEQVAIDAALEEVGKHTPVRYLRPIERKLLQYPEHKAELIVYKGEETNNEARLLYYLDMRPNFMARWAVFVDAKDGKVVFAYDHTCTVGPVGGSGRDLKNVSRNFGVFEANTNQYMMVDASRQMYTGSQTQVPDLGDGIIITADMNNSSLSSPNYRDVTSNSRTSWSTVAVSAHFNAITSYEYFRTTHSRNSINGGGGDIVSFINVADDDGGGLDNAFWNGQAIFYGGGRTVFQPLARGLDVAAHEMSHGVVQETANLEYKNESGALNESFADIFGAMVDRDDWKIGEDVMRNGGSLRDMQNPHNGAAQNDFNAGWQPEKYSERYTGSQDNGGVHINSGIPNRAFYLFATANGVDRAKAEKVFYKALSRYLTRSSRFIDLRLAVVRAAEENHGANSTEVNAAKAAFDQVEIFDPNGGGGGGGGGGGQTPTPPPGNLTPNPGPEFLISTDVNLQDANTLYVSDVNGSQNSFSPLTTLDHFHKVSVTDDGSRAVIVGSDGHMYTIDNPTTASPQINRLSVNPVWENAVISKDGRRLAAFQTSVDTSIYVYDLDSNPIRGARYRLYNPTYTQGVSFSGMLYADAMEFDYSGENLAFDAFNRIRNVSGPDLTFWTIGFLKVWDNGANNFGEGTIDLLVGQLDPGENIGEPAFSKNSPHIMAFDYFTDEPINPGDGGYYMLGMNLNSDTINIMRNQDKLTVPNYSRLDDRIVFNAIDGNGNDILAVFGVGSNKISAATNASGLIGAAKWGVHVATGSRSLEPVSNGPLMGDIPFQMYPNPASEAVTCRFSLETGAEAELEIVDMTGRNVRALEPRRFAAGEQQLRVSVRNLPSGTYALHLRLGSDVVVRKLVVQ